MARGSLAEQAAVDEELLRLLARQSRRLPYPVGVSALVIAAMAWGSVPHGWVLGWISLVFSVLAFRRWALQRLAVPQHRPARKRLRWASGLSALNGIVYSASVAFVPFLSDYERMVQTILLLGLCAGSVATTAGYWPVLLSFLLPLSLSNSLAWSLGGGGQRPVTWLELALAGLILAFAWILAGMARDAYRIFVDSVLIRHQQASSNQQLSLALERAESAISAKTRFLAAASHDLRQPMHTLSLFGAALMRRPLDDVSTGIVRSMNLAVQSLAAQMDVLLDISKLDAGVVQVKPRVFGLQLWLARLCQEMQAAANGKGLALELGCPADAFVETDPVLLERVLRNLIDNAIKYTDQGHISVMVERDEAVWRVCICDTGRGIAADEQARIFEEFYQVGNPERDRANGLGLGLSIVARLVDLLDLHLGLSSVLGQGCRFSLGLEAAELGLAPDEAGEPSAGQLPHLHVLVLDDEAPVREAMAALLQGYGCDVTAVGSTREAILQSLMRRPDIVLSDLRLRGADDGISALRSLRSALPGLPAVLITGDTAPERLREAHAAGLVLLHKPVLEAQLLGAIRTALAEQTKSASPDSQLNI
ncbi:hybrid sensor histidine kinase/response regulator [Roseateles oligotrophus]|uniref:histidine kinase n=1 Tax=Roseateles oligotrophus TaxID=1769250 RepID=A0ABT2YBE8_9BURK|nr:hybrid sensor histidine kinase/response regulator [Roseateles oligotrophus]MCV2367515.1 hybrid sensor histidine kinase/response regulator [Roseateles oligotrophus]